MQCGCTGQKKFGGFIQTIHFVEKQHAGTMVKLKKRIDNDLKLINGPVTGDGGRPAVPHERGGHQEVGV